jgi:hypothetical protein
MPDLNDDTLWGAKEIGAYIKQTARQAHYQLQNKLIPGGQIGGKWVASRKALDEHFRAVTSSKAA